MVSHRTCQGCWHIATAQDTPNAPVLRSTVIHDAQPGFCCFCGQGVDRQGIYIISPNGSPPYCTRKETTDVQS